ncbi:hypothetical protein [Bifidobacterium bifidum]|uniref:hypothetical protein n=1 Tax=Bifidobacterium bifidum TaxID=1681 RepID=UPI000D57AE6F|nr:hypothetical protein [Bifidobacterium bifidum]PVV33073.1 hypothetical protein DD715_03440 [Bifidobacterium bifidum]
MPTKSYKWSPADFAAARTIDKMLTTVGLGNREFDRASDGAINYGRVRDLRNGLKAPVRLSEFLIVCDVCGADPVQTVRDILAEARRIEAERAADEVADRIAANPDDFDVAASIDPHKRDEANTPRE